jgi:GT2 family glycosyltransferase
MTSASLIVINWNGGAFLENCLKSLLSEVTKDDEIIVVDNDSSDDSVDLLRARFPEVKLVCNARNLGYAGGANAGLTQARSDVLILLNPDVQVHAGWLDALKCALQIEATGVAGCKLLYPGEQIIQHAGGSIHFPLGNARHLGYRERDLGQWDQEREVDYVTGAAIAIRRDVIDRVGVFDIEFYPAYFEEVDFCFRARAAGFHVQYIPWAVATHYEYAALEDQGEAFFRYYHRNRLRFVLKHKGIRFFLDEFAPAESLSLQDKVSIQERAVMAHVYLEIMLAVPRLCLKNRDCTGAGKSDDLSAVLGALANLRGRVWSS